MRTRVKICGITNGEDAKVAVANGADAIGLVFYRKSPRYVTLEQARHIVEVVPAFVAITALFVDPTVEEVEEVISATKVDLLQFHGEEAEAFCSGFSRPYIKAVRMKHDSNLSTLAKEYATAKGMLLDTYVKGIPGGTGEAFNWDWVSKDKQTSLNMPVILAGGLHAGNVERAIEIVEPWAVDVSGGVELMPGKKSETKIEQFIKAVNEKVRR
ncbi:phosphoribosylanthranilate isomerase [Hydrogenovibrio sp. JE_KL2]|nr:phosphoribosylanthranilate isomerase [Hydrogenovibrio sp. JE_KL2]